MDGAAGDDNVVIQPIPAIDAAAPGVVAAGRDSAALGGDLTAGDGDNIGVDAAAGIIAILFAGRDRAAGGFDGAAGDGGVVSGVNAIALKLCRPAGGGDVAASDDDIAPGVNAVAFTAVCGGIAAGGGQAAAAGDGEGNNLTIITINIDAVAIYKIIRSARPGDGVVALQDDFQVSFFVVIDGGVIVGAMGDGRAIEGQGGAVPLDVPVILGGGKIPIRAFLAAREFHAAHEDGAADLRVLGTALVRQQGADGAGNQTVAGGVGVEVEVDGGQRNRCVAGVLCRFFKGCIHIGHGVSGGCARRNGRVQCLHGAVKGRQVKQVSC